MPRIRKFLRFFQDRPILADLLAAAGMLAYLVQIWKSAQNQVSVLDEGLYLFKGWMFSTGAYTPFQPYGVWTNQMPLAFLIPGWVELIFGPGLQTGRIMAVALAALMLPGLWLTARRLGGRWIACGVTLALALNPAAIRMEAVATSQGLVACILVWCLWFSLGSGRKPWQLLAGGLLAGAAVMVRINLLPLLPLLALYVLWAQGWKAFSWSLTGMLVVFGGLHLYYWPNILQLWAKWLPFGFLKPWFPPPTIPTWKPDNPLAYRIASFFLAFRYHFAALAGALAAWVFWPKREKITADHHKIAVFLSVLLVIFFLLHAWAALGNEYCVFCFPTYTAFYAGVGLLLAAVTLPSWNLDPPTWRKSLGAVSFLVMLAGMAYSAEGAAENMLGPLFYKRLLSLPVPGLNGVLLWQILANKFRLEYQNLYDSFHTWFPVLLVVLFGLGLFVLTWLSTRNNTKVPDRFANQIARDHSGQAVGSSTGGQALLWGWGILFLLAAGTIFSPAPVLAGDYTTYDCPASVVSGYQAAGAQLEQSIPAGSKIFWAGYSPVTLLYLPGMEIQPGQLHGAYSFRISPDDDALLKYGWWNENLAEKWLNEADFVIAEQKNLGKGAWLGVDGRLDNFELVTETAPQTCQASSAMLLYRRK